MKVNINQDLIEAAVMNSFKVMSSWLEIPKSKNNTIEVLDINEFMSNWFDYLKYLNGNKNGDVEFVDLTPYKTFEEYAAKFSKNAKSVVILKLQKSVAADAAKCEDFLYQILSEAFGEFNLTNIESAFTLQSKRSVYAGLMLSY